MPFVLSASTAAWLQDLRARDQRNSGRPRHARRRTNISYKPGGDFEVGYVTLVTDEGGGVYSYDAEGPSITVTQAIPRDRVMYPGLSYSVLSIGDPVQLTRILDDEDVLQPVIWSAQEVRGTTACTVPEE